MRMQFDPEAEAPYIHLLEVPVEDNLGIEESVAVDLDSQEHTVGIDILDASVRSTGELLSVVAIENLLPARAR